MRKLLWVETELGRILLKAGLFTGDTRRLLGQQYFFKSEHGSHEEILVGTIQAIGWSDEGGLQLLVTNPRFFGRPLISISYVNSEWGALIDVSPAREFYQGELYFVP